MKNYVELIKDIMVFGVDRSDRTGVGSRFRWGAQLHFQMENGFPATTVRPVPLRWVFEETMFFLRGLTQTKHLEAKGITIWKGNTTREFLDKRGLTHLPEGDMGKGYGYQWRCFGSGAGSRFSPGVDQIKELVDGLINDPESRRHLVSAWNPMQLKEMALPPCHILQHHYLAPRDWNTNEPQLNTCFWMRSNDVLYGLPFNIVQYAFLNLIFAKLLKVKPGTLVYQCSDAHIYANQFTLADDIIHRYNTRGLKPLPKVSITKELNSLEDIVNLSWDDIDVDGYDPHPDFKNKPGMAV